MFFCDAEEDSVFVVQEVVEFIFGNECWVEDPFLHVYVFCGRYLGSYNSLRQSLTNDVMIT